MPAIQLDAADESVDWRSIFNNMDETVCNRLESSKAPSSLTPVSGDDVSCTWEREVVPAFCTPSLNKEAYMRLPIEW